MLQTRMHKVQYVEQYHYQLTKLHNLFNNIYYSMWQ